MPISNIFREDYCNYFKIAQGIDLTQPKGNSGNFY